MTNIEKFLEFFSYFSFFLAGVVGGWYLGDTIFPAFSAHAQVLDSYVRTPDSFSNEINQDLDINVVITAITEGDDSAQAVLTDSDSIPYFGDCVGVLGGEVNGNVYSDFIDSEVSFTNVQMQFYSDDSCGIPGASSNINLEDDGGNTIFEFVEQPDPPASTTVQLSTDPVQNVLLACFLVLYTAGYVRRIFYSNP
jgi:hypothetical protein